MLHKKHNPWTKERGLLIKKNKFQINESTYLWEISKAYANYVYYKSRRSKTIMLQ